MQSPHCADNTHQNVLQSNFMKFRDFLVLLKPGQLLQWFSDLSWSEDLEFWQICAVRRKWLYPEVLSNDKTVENLYTRRKFIKRVCCQKTMCCWQAMWDVETKVFNFEIDILIMRVKIKNGFKIIITTAIYPIYRLSIM